MLKKNKKDEHDSIIFDKKLELLNIEEVLKRKEVELKDLEINYKKQKHEIELNHIKRKQDLEIELIQEEIKIKKLEFRIKEQEKNVNTM